MHREQHDQRHRDRNRREGGIREGQEQITLRGVEREREGKKRGQEGRQTDSKSWSALRATLKLIQNLRKHCKDLKRHED